MKETAQHPNLTLIPIKQTSPAKVHLPTPSAQRVRKSLRHDADSLQATAKAMNILATFIIAFFSIASGFVKKAAIAEHFASHGVVNEKLGIVCAIACCLIGLALASAFIIYSAILATVADSISTSIKRLGKEVQG